MNKSTYDIPGFQPKWVIRKPGTNLYFLRVQASGTIKWTTYDNAYRFSLKSDAMGVNLHAEGILIMLSRETLNYSADIVL